MLGNLSLRSKCIGALSRDLLYSSLNANTGAHTWTCRQPRFKPQLNMYSIMHRAKREAGLLPKTTYSENKKEANKKINKDDQKVENPAPAIIRRPISPTERVVKVPTPFTQPANPRLCKVALLGAANAGKSTLINSLIGENISVVSARAHTTRERILAAWTKDNYQIVFLDTPGVIYGRNQSKMNRNLVNASWQSLQEADHCSLFALIAMVPCGCRTNILGLQYWLL